MKRQIALFVLALGGASLWAQQATVSGPDNLLKVDISVTDGNPFYSVTYRGKTILENSPLGFVSNVGDFSREMTYAGQKSRTVEENYRLDRIKRSEVAYRANELTVTLENAEKKPVDVTFRVSDNDIAFRYEMPRYGETGSIVIKREATGFDFPSHTTVFLTPPEQADDRMEAYQTELRRRIHHGRSPHHPLPVRRRVYLPRPVPHRR